MDTPHSVNPLTVAVSSWSRIFRHLSLALLVGSSGFGLAQSLPKSVSVKPSVEKSAAIINVNTADAMTLAGLDGIGDAKAAAIVEYRKQHGAFKSVDQLADVKGIGEKFIEKNRTRISVR